MTLLRKATMASICSLAAMLVGCASTIPLQNAQIDKITRDSPPAEVDQTIGKATAIAEFEWATNEQRYWVRHFQLQTGERLEVAMACTAYGCTPFTYAVAVTAPYLVIQNLPSRTMHAWGTIESLSKDPDPRISAIMPALKVKLEAVMQEKKK